MAKVVFDFTEAKEIDRTPVPAGVYLAVIDSTYAEQIKYGREKGTPYVSLGFVISEPEEYRNRVVFNNYMLSGPGSGGAKMLMRKLGLYNDEDGLLFSFDTRALHGYAVKIRVKEVPDQNGDLSNNITMVEPADAAA